MKCRLMKKEEVRDLVRRGWIPGSYLTQFDQLYVYGAYDDSDFIVAVCIFADNFAERFALEFKYVYVHDKYRGNGYAGALYSYAESKFAQIGIRKILAENIIRLKDSRAFYELMAGLGFEPIYLNHSVIRFERGHFQGQQADRLYSNIKKSGLNIEAISNYHDRRLMKFWTMNEKTGIFVPEADYDPTLCVFGLEKDVILAALCMKRTDETSLVTEGFYVSDEVKNKDYVLPFMMSYLVRQASEYGMEIQDIYGVFEKEYRRTAVEQVFGKGLEIYFQQKYEKELT